MTVMPGHLGQIAAVGTPGDCERMRSELLERIQTDAKRVHARKMTRSVPAELVVSPGVVGE